MTRGIERLTIYCLGTVAWSHCDFLLPLFLFETSTTHPRTRAPEEKIYSWRNPLRECKRCIRYVERIHRGFRGFQYKIGTRLAYAGRAPTLVSAGLGSWLIGQSFVDLDQSWAVCPTCPSRPTRIGTPFKHILNLTNKLNFSNLSPPVSNRA